MSGNRTATITMPEASWSFLRDTLEAVCKNSAEPLKSDVRRALDAAKVTFQNASAAGPETKQRPFILLDNHKNTLTSALKGLKKK